MDNNNKKSKLLFFTVITIVALLFVGIVYQFIQIKTLQKKLNALENKTIITYISEDKIV